MTFPNLRIISSFSRPWNPSTVRISTSSNPAPSQIRLLNQEQNQFGPNQDFFTDRQRFDADRLSISMLIRIQIRILPKTWPS